MVDESYDGPVLRSYDPTLRERIYNWISDFGRPDVTGKPNRGAQEFARGVSEIIPGLRFQDAYRDLEAGQYGSAASNALQAGSSVAPFAFRAPAAEAGMALRQSSFAPRAATTEGRVLSGPAREALPYYGNSYETGSLMPRGGSSPGMRGNAGSPPIRSMDGEILDRADMIPMGGGSRTVARPMRDVQMPESARGDSIHFSPDFNRMMTSGLPLWNLANQEDRGRVTPILPEHMAGRSPTDYQAPRAQAASGPSFPQTGPIPPRRPRTQADDRMGFPQTGPIPPRRPRAEAPAARSAPVRKPEYLSTGEPLVGPDDRINYGNPESAADFFRADRARMERGYASGGAADRAASIAHERATPCHHGIINMAVGGRTDHLPMNVLEGSYVLPADIVSGLGEGNTLAGTKILDQMFSVGPFGTKPSQSRGSPKFPSAGYHAKSSSPYEPPQYAATGGAIHRRPVPIVAAGGEYVVHPDVVQNLGKGNMDSGHDYLDNFVKFVRAHTAKTLQNLPPPRRD